MAMLRHRAAQRSTVDARLLVSARGPEDVLYRGELMALGDADGLSDPPHADPQRAAAAGAAGRGASTPRCSTRSGRRRRAPAGLRLRAHRVRRACRRPARRRRTRPGADPRRALRPERDVKRAAAALVAFAALAPAAHAHTWCGAQVASARWIMLPEGKRLIVRPTTCGRRTAGRSPRAAFAEAIRRGGGGAPDYRSLYWQFVCHAQYAATSRHGTSKRGGPTSAWREQWRRSVIRGERPLP